MRRFFASGAVILAVLALASATPGWAAPQEKPAYTPAEYNAYTACANDKNAQTRAKCLEDFVAKFPESTLLPYVYRLDYLTYYELKNYVKTVERADRLLELGDKLEFTSKLEALVARGQAFYLGQNQPALSTPQQLTKAHEHAQRGLQAVEQWQKPEQLSEQQYEQQKRGFRILFHSVSGISLLGLKKYEEAAESLRAALVLDGNDALNTYRLGVAYLQMEPPKQMDGFWALARSVALKGPIEAQVRPYLRNQLIRYQQTVVCEKEIDAQFNELVTLAAGTAERPADYKIPSAADLEAARRNTDWLNVLKAGGETAKVTWLAMCGLEFPEVFARVFEVTPGNDSLLLKIYTGTSQEDMESAVAPNCEVKAKDQPLAANYQKDDYFRFAGTLAGYTPDPFTLKWDNAKINPEDLPEEKAAPGKQPTKRPAGKRPTKRPPAR